MDKSLLEHFQDLKSTINRGVTPMVNINLPTPIIKKILGMYLTQSFFFSIWWSFKEGSITPLFITFSTLLQIGWFWNKVTDSWKLENNNNILLSTTNLEPSFYEPIQAPVINIHNEPLTDIRISANNNHPLLPSNE